MAPPLPPDPPATRLGPPPSGLVDTLLVAAVLFLTVVPVGTAVFVLGFVHGDSPCVLCWQQRVGMSLVALLGLFVLRYGPRPRYLGAAVLVGAWGVFMGLRHAGLHLARDVGQGFSAEIFGAHTYTWSFFIFWCAVVVMGVLLTLLREGVATTGAPRALRPVDRVAVVAFLAVMAGNLVQAFASTGPPPFAGQADPVRFSFNPRHWVWSLEEYRALPVSLRGRWAIAKPDVGRADPDPATGPFGVLPRLAVVDRRRLDLPLRGRPTGLAYDETLDRFLLTTEHGLHLTDGRLERVVGRAVVDPLFAVDLGRFAGAAFLDPRTVLGVTENKSYVVLHEAEGRADADRNFRYFLEGADEFDERVRSRLATVRARMMYVMAAAVDTATGSLYTVTVPGSPAARLVVSRFDTADMTVSEEFVPRIAGDLAPGPGGDGSALDRLYITAATMSDGRLYLLSAAHGTLLAIDPVARAVVAAHTVEGLSRPTGLAVRGGTFYVVSDEGVLTRVAFAAANRAPSRP